MILFLNGGGHLKYDYKGTIQNLNTFGFFLLTTSLFFAETIKTKEIDINAEKGDKNAEKLDKKVEKSDKDGEVSDAESEDFEILEPDENHPDEDLDKVFQDNPDEIEESENVQHLREVKFDQFLR